MYALTPEQRSKYVNVGGSHCPYCGGTEVEGGSIDVEGASVSQRVCCLNCACRWYDLYELTDVVDDHTTFVLPADPPPTPDIEVAP